jgi:hypothetical protein
MVRFYTYCRCSCSVLTAVNEGVEIALEVEYCWGLIHRSQEYGRRDFPFQSLGTFPRRHPTAVSAKKGATEQGQAAGRATADAGLIVPGKMDVGPRINQIAQYTSLLAGGRAAPIEARAVSFVASLCLLSGLKPPHALCVGPKIAARMTIALKTHCDHSRGPPPKRGASRQKVVRFKQPH